MAATLTSTTRPRPVPILVPLPAPTGAQKDCSMCQGKGGKWVTNDGKSKGKDIARWVACTGCKGTGKVG
ncbi:hypothetical protein ABZ249_25230 [Nocardiopsis sp. NPDC006139]|uniref:hypothetical protein n=1 Tax=Nocardiopsis sp. NPDC006139 TaxID=3154578 RepID=UPI0033AEA30F